MGEASMVAKKYRKSFFKLLAISFFLISLINPINVFAESIVSVSFNSLEKKFKNSNSQVEKMNIIKEIWKFGAINQDEATFFLKLLDNENKIIKYYSALALWSTENHFIVDSKIPDINKYLIEMIKDEDFEFFVDFKNIIFSRRGDHKNLLYDLVKLAKNWKESIPIRKRTLKTLNIMAKYYNKHGYKQSVKIIKSAIVGTIFEKNEELALSSSFLLGNNEEIYGTDSRSITTPIFLKFFNSEKINDEKKADIAFSLYKKTIKNKKVSKKYLDIIVGMLNNEQMENNIRKKISYKLSKLPSSYLTIPYLSGAAFDNSDPKMQEYAILQLANMLYNVHMLHGGVNLENKEIIVDKLYDKIFPVISKLLKHPYYKVRRYSYKFIKKISSEIITKKDSELRAMLKSDDIRIVEKAKAALIIKKFDTKKLKSDIELMKNIPIPARQSLSPPTPPLY